MVLLKINIISKKPLKIRRIFFHLIKIICQKKLKILTLIEGVLLDELSLCGLRLFSSFFIFLLLCIMSLPFTLPPPADTGPLPFSCGDLAVRPLCPFWPPLPFEFILLLLFKVSLWSSTTSSLSDFSLSLSRSSSRSRFTFFMSCCEWIESAGDLERFSFSRSRSRTRSRSRLSIRPGEIEPRYSTIKTILRRILTW